MRASSLTARVLVIATVWAVIALVVIALVIQALYRTGSERAFRDLLRAQLNSVINAVSMDPEGRLSGDPELGDLAFARPGSGWIWIVDPLPAVGGKTAARLASVSIGNDDIASPSLAAVPFDSRYIRAYSASDASGNALEVVETEVDLVNGAARFRVAGNREVLEDDVAAFSGRLFLALALFGIGSVVINALAILYGLKPLDDVSRALGRIRAGEADALTGAFPREIAPLAGEVNALIEMNRRVVDRARMQVGNLAHSLKTPIAVLLNESKDMTEAHGKLVRIQADTMQAQVQTYLDRARIAAQRGSVLARTEARPSIERLVRVMRKLNPELEFVADIAPGNAIVSMEQQDFEEILGNLVENAAKFARGRVEVRLRPAPAPDGAAADRGWISLSIDDDGPGLTEPQMAEAMKRGRRLDESKPGTGLGLSIVSEISAEYHGRIRLDRSASGGLSAQLLLPSLLS
ncbi:signal transduction histidine kinase [Hoeflea marina]|uniref:histidine kinase n=1 Tax=Hoeflea marina TaxID=274592 RepID=A0A317PQJ9_9HYPH|nr:HAMP domain-containing sensor histidine kinase [Hoeflea marina]PWW02228.1 signal transduction histidine kinase [Hoeflea marina]